MQFLQDLQIHLHQKVKQSTKGDSLPQLKLVIRESRNHPYCQFEYAISQTTHRQSSSLFIFLFLTLAILKLSKTGE